MPLSFAGSWAAILLLCTFQARLASCQTVRVQFLQDNIAGFEDETLNLCVEPLDPISDGLVGVVLVVGQATNTATEVEDYSFIENVVTFQTGQLACAVVDVVDDDIVEGSEIFRVAVVGSGLSPAQANVIIVDNDVDEVPRVEFVEGDFSVTETGAPEVPVCVQLLDNPSAVIIAFINSFDETATDGIDYVVTQSLLTFSPGDSTAGCFTVQINDDMVAESDETFSLFLMSNTEDFQLITVTIRDDPLDPPVIGFQILGYNINEGETFQACAQIFSGGSSQTFSLQMVSISGTATAVGESNADVEQVLTAIEFEGVSSAGDAECVEVVVLQDLISEETEFFFLGLFPIVGQTVPLVIDPLRRFSIVNILNRDVQPPSAVVAFVVREVEVPEDIGRLSVCIQLISAFPLTQDVKVAISSNDGSAVSTPIPPDPQDYVSVNATITLASGTPDGTTTCTSVSIVDDEVLENSETFSLDLTSLSPVLGVLGDYETLTVSIEDNEPPVSVFRVLETEIQVRENALLIRVCLGMVSNGPLLQDVFFDLIGENRTAIGFQDFVTFGVPPIRFLAGARRRQVSCEHIPIIDDDVPEDEEEFAINFFSTDENVAILEDSTITVVTIVDDDVLYVGLVPLGTIVNENEEEVFVCVRVFGGEVLTDRTILLGTQDGSAVEMEDYRMVRTELTFAAGTQPGDLQCVAIPIIDNNRPDGDRHFDVNIVSFTPFVRILEFLTSKAIWIIDDDESQVELERSEYRVLENEGPIEVCVVLVGAALNEIGLVAVSTEDGSATGGVDYTVVTTSLTFVGGSNDNSSLCVSIPILDDTIAEADQSFTVSISSLTPEVFTVAEGGSIATVTIIDDEDTGLPEVGFTVPEFSVFEGTDELTEACVRVTGDLGAGQTAILDIISSPGSALAVLDYGEVLATLTLPPNVPSGTITCVTFHLVDDEEMEETEYFSLRIVNRTPNIVTVNEGDDLLIVRILDDEFPIPVVGLQVAESVVNETVDNKFTCIEIISGGPLRFDATITFYTQDGSATAPEDYTAVSLTLTFREGAVEGVPSDVVCVNVPIIDDAQFEETESLTLKIAAVDDNRIIVDEARSEKVLYIQDNDAIYVGFEREIFTISEDLNPEFGLLVCVTVEDVPFPFQLFTEAEDGTATEIEDYRVNNAPLQFVEAGGNQTQCAYVQVVSDNIFELTEFFRLLLISDDPGVVVITPYANIRIKDSADPEI